MLVGAAFMDPDTFTAPFTGELPFNRIDEMVYEYACHEGNHAMENILSGERSKERREAAAAKSSLCSPYMAAFLQPQKLGWLALVCHIAELG